MKKTTVALITIAKITLTSVVMAKEATIGIAIHGGAGTISKQSISDSQEKAYRLALKNAIDAGNDILKNGGSSLDAITAAIVMLEDNPLFNAGAGAVYTYDKEHELDASIMNGADLSAGAVAGVSDIKNPIVLAREVMQNSQHVMLSGSGASEFAKRQGLATVPPSYFATPKRLQDWQKANRWRKKPSAKAYTGILTADANNTDYKFGTVGAVALDRHGNLAAGTSTGGMTNKRFGRIGDSPVIGAGTYANNESCAVSATGHGEYFIRYTVAHDICARKQYLGMTLDQAADEVINKLLVAAGGGGGVIAIDAAGNISLQFNTKGMYRAYSKNGAEPVVLIYEQ